MQIQILAIWNNTPWFEAGERLFEIDWEFLMIPVEKQKINLNELIKRKEIPIQTIETFEYEEKQYNIFQWIQDEHFWTIKDVIWFPCAEGVSATVVITDSQYYENRLKHSRIKMIPK